MKKGVLKKKSKIKYIFLRTKLQQKLSEWNEEEIKLNHSHCQKNQLSCPKNRFTEIYRKLWIEIFVSKINKFSSFFFIDTLISIDIWYLTKKKNLIIQEIFRFTISNFSKHWIFNTFWAFLTVWSFKTRKHSHPDLDV